LIEKYNIHNNKKTIEKLAKTILKLYNHIIKKDVKIVYRSLWSNDNKYIIKFYNNNSYESYNLIFWLMFEIIKYPDAYNSSDYHHIDEFDVKISLNNSNAISHMIKCEDFLKYFKVVLIFPYYDDHRYYEFYTHKSIRLIPDLISKLSIEEYDLMNDLKKFNL